MKRALLVLFLLCCQVHAQTSTTVVLVPNVDSCGTDLSATRIRPVGTGPFHAVLVIHGAQFKSGPRGPLGVGQDLATAGYLAFVVEHRLAPPADGMRAGPPPCPGPGQCQVNPAPPSGGCDGLSLNTLDGRPPNQTNDTKADIIAVRADPDCDGLVGVVGGSSGGSHAMFAAATGTAGVDRPDIIVCLSGIYDYDDPDSWGETGTGRNPKYTADLTNYMNVIGPPSSAYTAASLLASPQRQTGFDSIPIPMLAISSDSDTIPRPQIDKLYDELIAHGRDVQRVWRITGTNLPDPSIGHSFNYWNKAPFDGSSFPLVKDLVIDFLNRKFSGSPPPPQPVDIISLVTTSLVVGAPMAAPPPVIPSGMVYFPSNRTVDTNIFSGPDNSNIDGVVIAAPWFDLEPTPDNYQFNSPTTGDSLDTMISKCEAAGKWMKVSILTGGGPPVPPVGYIPGSKPQWLIDMIDADSTPIKYVTFVDPDNGNLRKFPVFWEPTLIARHIKVAQNVAAHLASHPLVKAITVSYANSNTNDWGLGDVSNTPDGLPGTESCDGGVTVGTPCGRWKVAAETDGFATWQAAMISAGQQTYLGYINAFPGKVLSTPIGRVNQNALNPGPPGIIPLTVANYAYALDPGFISSQINSLDADISNQAAFWGELDALPGIKAAQMLFSTYGDTACNGDSNFPTPWGTSFMNNKVLPCINVTVALTAAIDNGVGHNTRWQEIYEKDITHLGSGNQDPDHTNENVVAYAHSKLFLP